jgi:site-specific DNA-adenine methylase
MGKKPELLIEPFAGGGGVGLMTAFEKRAGKLLLVELDPDIATVWRVILSEESKSLNERIDPPYPVAGRRLYRFHDLDHRRLFKVRAQLKGRFLATYDHNPEFEALAKEFGFDTRLTPMKSTHHLKKFELLISRDLSWFSERSEDPSRPCELSQASA